MRTNLSETIDICRVTALIIFVIFAPDGIIDRRLRGHTLHRHRIFFVFELGGCLARRSRTRIRFSPAASLLTEIKTIKVNEITFCDLSV